ncbi:major facilitator superfamily domain-containing protein [Mrakia frigida]|uniref:major facilitator superfamily domain-containing protein n=1 Tax=Mrakia frigida TaxID=29902 RepID=UPI003FCBF86C
MSASTSPAPVNPDPTPSVQGSTRANSFAPSEHLTKEEEMVFDAERKEGQEIVGAPPSTGPPAGAHPLPPPMTRLQFVLVFGSMMLAVFLFSLDQLILATFNSLAAVAWLQNGFFVTLCSFTLAFSQYMTIFPSKYVFLFAIFVFELGSLLCGVAPNMDVLILGRCVAGVGAAGIFGAAFQTTIEITTLQERSTYIALFGACFGLSSVIGPLLGGALTDKATWRWCFLINLPIGGVAFLCILFLLKPRPPLGAGNDSRSLLTKIVQLDWVGVGIALASTVCICLAFQYGGVEKAWNSASVIVLFVMIPVSLGLLVAWEFWLGPERAMIPLALFKRRTIIGCAGAAGFGWLSFMAVVLYISISFQAVNGHSATRAGTDLLPMIVVQTVLIVAMGRIVAKFGRYKWIIVAGPLIMALGCGLVYSANALTQFAHVLGFIVLIGVGVAFFLQNVMVAAQVELKTEPRLIARGVGMVNFVAFIGRIGISVATSIFSNLLPLKLDKYAPDLPPTSVSIVRDSVLAIRNVAIVPLEMQAGVVEAYQQSIRPIYLFALVACICSSLCALIIKDDTTHETPSLSEAKKQEEVRDLEKQEREVPTLEG